MLRERFRERLLSLTGTESIKERKDYPPVLLGVSGGIDSMTLAHLFYAVDYPAFAVATVNFSLRGDESDADEELVRKWCVERGVRFFCTKFDTESYAAQNGISTQMAARDLRLDWFREIAAREGFRFLAIAHNLNDRAETLMLNLLRGTGIRGLSAIRETSTPAGSELAVIRPLLGFSREEIEKYATSVSLPFRHDRTNFESHYSRNRIRNEVFPQFREINPHFLNTLDRNIEIFSETGSIIDELFSNIKGAVTTIENEGRAGERVLVDINKLRGYGHTGYWLFMILEEFGYNPAVVNDILESLDRESGKIFESPSHRVLKDRDNLIISPLKADSLSPAAAESKVLVRVYDMSDTFKPEASERIFYLDADLTGYPVTIRKWVSGDRFRPLGMTGFKKVSDYLTDKKRDIFTKEDRLVAVTPSGEITCLLGERIDDRFKITVQTKRILELELLQ